MNDPYNLQRFVEAQSGTYEQALGEISRGRKTSHWMWFVFPQLAGLGHSSTAKFYGISSLNEAKAYLDHPVLGARLRECVEALQALPTSDAEGVFGDIDALKLRSSLTLFAEAGGGVLFPAALKRWCGGPDERTLSLIGA